MTEGPDRLIERVRETLRESPKVSADPRAVGRLLTAVWAAPRPSFWRRMFDSWRVPALSGLGAAAVAGAALLVGFLTRGTLIERVAPAPTTASAPSASEPPVRLAAASAEALETAPVLTQFVFDDRAAKSVSIVGEFNDWKAGKTPLTRLPSGLWTVSIPLTPGRHVYAFVRDDTLVVADPRAPKAGDADYGREGSVVMVFAR